MPENKYLNYSDEQLETLINRVYSGKIDPMHLPKDLYEATIEHLSENVIKGFGATISELADYGDKSTLMHYLHNTAQFSAAKTFQQVLAMDSELRDADGMKRSIDEFRDIAKQIHEDFNDTYLEAEANTAYQMSLMGKKWGEIEDNKEVLPLLMYVTVGDDRVSDECAQWDGVVLPVDDPFWDTNYPPNHFNCRCTVDQHEDDIKQTVLEGDQKSEPDSPLFRGNSGKDKEIFDKDHPYFDVPDKYDAFKDRNFGLPIPPHPRDYLSDDDNG